MQNDTNNISLSLKDFNRLSAFIYKECGIKMPPAKKIMLEARLHKRMKQLNLLSYSEYCDFLFNESNGDEIIHMIDVVTTNKTEFFREPRHFIYMTQNVLPDIEESGRNNSSNTINIWSAGCSTGEEPYTIAIVLEEYFSEIKNTSYNILASDISTQVLQKASSGIFQMDRINMMPYELKKKYFLKSKDKNKQLVKISGDIRQKIHFCRINLMENSFGIEKKQDMIFCRNVIIYFDKETQEKLIRKLCENLKTGGYLFIGNSETLFNMQLPLKQVAATIYRKI